MTHLILTILVLYNLYILFGYNIFGSLFKLCYIQKLVILNHVIMRFLCICWFSGGHVLVKCVKGTSQDDKEILLQMDYITDIVISNKTVTGTPYISPDSRNLVIVDEHTGQIKVFTVKENGKKLHFILATIYPQQQHPE